MVKVIGLGLAIGGLLVQTPTLSVSVIVPAASVQRAAVATSQ